MFIKGLKNIIGSAFLLVSINANAQLLLPGSTPKKQAPVKAAPKPPVKPPSKAPVKTTPPAAAKTTPPAAANTEEPSPKIKPASAEPVVSPNDLDKEIILFATLDELKLNKASGNTKKWSTERKILLYNLFRNKEMEKLADIEKEAKTILTAVSGIPSVYETVKESWTKNIFNNGAVQNFYDEKGIKNLQTSLNGMDEQTKKLYPDYLGLKSSYEKLNIEEDIKAYHLLMFDKELSGSEKEEINKANAIIVKVQSHLKSIYGVGVSAENILNYLYKGLDDLLRKKVKNYPASGIAKVNNFTSKNEDLTVQSSPQNTTGINITASNYGGTIYDPGITTAKMLKHEYSQAFRNSDLTAIKVILKGNVSAPMEALGGHTPLVFACAMLSNNEVLRYLIESGANLNATTYIVPKPHLGIALEKPFFPLKIAQSPLFIYCANNNFTDPETIRFIEYLLKKGARPYMSTDPEKRRNEAWLLQYYMTKDKVKIMKDFGIDLENDAKVTKRGIF
jgi:hypothetical protein